MGVGRLEGKRVLITGGASGIGRATAERFAAEGALVGLIDRQGPALAAASDELGMPGEQADLSDPDAAETAIHEQPQTQGGVHNSRGPQANNMTQK